MQHAQRDEPGHRSPGIPAREAEERGLRLFIDERTATAALVDYTRERPLPSTARGVSWATVPASKRTARQWAGHVW